MYKISLIGKLLYYCIPYRRRVVRDNIRQVFGESLSVASQGKLAQAFYTHLARSIYEMLLLRIISDEKLKSSVEVKGHQYLLDLANNNQGVLILTGHFGSWEFAPLGGILNFQQFQGCFHFIRRGLKNKYLERFLFKRYHRFGLHVIHKDEALTHVRTALDNNHAVVFVLDQHASLANRDGVAVEFFGKKAGTYRSLASLARHTGIPVVPAASYRLPNGKHVLEFHEPIYWQEYPSTQESIYQNTYLYNQALEKLILAHPEQWMWLHKRWKL